MKKSVVTSREILIVRIFYFSLFILVLMLASGKVYSQGASVNTSGIPADPSAIFDVNSASQGILFPRMSTAQRNAIALPAKGLVIYNLDCDNLNCNAGTPVSPNWVFVNASNNFPAAPVSGSHVSTISQITWNWNTVSGATGYKWNTTNDFNSATDNGAATSYVQTGLTCNNSYALYVWAYSECGYSSATALNQNSAVCPPVYCTVNSTCSGAITDSRDSKVYGVVQIGNQCWMSENLNVGAFVGGGTTQSTGGDNWNGSVQKYCYNDNTSNCNTYGGLYQWNEMMAYGTSVGGTGAGPQGICPTGWHLPTDNEWKCLEMNLGMSQSEADGITFRGTNEAGSLKQAGTSLWTAPNAGATNSSGFNALPGGWGGGFSEINNQGRWAAATEGDSGNAWGRYLYSNDARVFRYNNGKSYGFSVRCIKNS